MEDLTQRLCWELLKEEGDIFIWRKPLNNSCYLSRAPAVQPSLCDAGDDPDNVWYFLHFCQFHNIACSNFTNIDACLTFFLAPV